MKNINKPVFDEIFHCYLEIDHILRRLPLKKSPRRACYLLNKTSYWLRRRNNIAWKTGFPLKQINNIFKLQYKRNYKRWLNIYLKISEFETLVAGIEYKLFSTDRDEEYRRLKELSREFSDALYYPY